MKNILLLAGLFLNLLTKAQEDPYCYNGGNITSPSETVSETKLPDVEQENSLILMPVMNEKMVIRMLKEKTIHLSISCLERSNSLKVLKA